MSVKMKDSGIEWIGEIPEHWEVIKGKYILNLLKKNVKETDDVVTCFRDGEVTLRRNRREEGFTISEKEIGYQGIDIGDLVVHGMDGFAGAIGISDSRGKGSPVLNVLDSSQNKKYLMYFLRDLAYKDIFLATATGIRVRSCDLRWNKLAELDFIVPPIEEQRLIAVQLNQICGMLDNTKADIEKQIKILNEYKKSVMLETFEFYCNKYSYNNVKINNLSKLVTKQTGFDYSTYISPALLDTKEENTLPFLQTKNFKSNYFNLNTDYYIPKEVAYRFNKILLNKKSLLFSIVGASIGNVAVYPGKEEAFLGGAICKVDLINEELYDYIKYYMLSPKGQDQILVKVNSNAQGTITVQNVRDFKVPIFKDSINRRIVTYLDSKCSEIDSIIETKKQQLELLEEYKKSIIYEYVTGKREVSIESAGDSYNE